MAILAPLRELDDVAFLRFASVYKQFESADDFEIEIASLRKHRAEQLAALLDSDVGRPHLSPQRLTTDRPVRRGEAAYRAHHTTIQQKQSNPGPRETEHDRDGERGRAQEGAQPRV